MISIIVPVYNAEKYLNRCISSLLNQTYYNLEIILVNDGSTDNSKKICENAAKNDSRIKLINSVNEGVSLARNKQMEIIFLLLIQMITSNQIMSKKCY